jgi:hypothetical protein
VTVFTGDVNISSPTTMVAQIKLTKNRNEKIRNETNPIESANATGASAMNHTNIARPTVARSLRWTNHRGSRWLSGPKGAMAVNTGRKRHSIAAQ